MKPARFRSASQLLSPDATNSLSRSITSRPLHHQLNTLLALFAEIIHPRDPRSGRFDAEKREELNFLISLATFRVVIGFVVADHPNNILTRFMLDWKQKQNGLDVYRAEPVVTDHRGRDKGNVVQSTITLKKASIRILLTLASIFGFDMYFIAVDQGYLQTDLQSIGKIKKQDILDISSKDMPQFAKPIYGLSDSEDY